MKKDYESANLEMIAFDRNMDTVAESDPFQLPVTNVEDLPELTLPELKDEDE